MDGKKSPGRFTLQFNLDDPHQSMAADILNRQGRSKAQFLTSAVLHYINCPETPDYQPPASAFPMEELERLVVEILNRRTGAVPMPEESVAPQIEEVVPKRTHLLPAEGAALNQEDLSAIAHTLAAFRT